MRIPTIMECSELIAQGRYDQRTPGDGSLKYAAFAAGWMTYINISVVYRVAHFDRLGCWDEQLDQIWRPLTLLFSTWQNWDRLDRFYSTSRCQTKMSELVFFHTAIEDFLVE